MTGTPPGTAAHLSSSTGAPTKRRPLCTEMRRETARDAATVAAAAAGFATSASTVGGRAFAPCATATTGRRDDVGESSGSETRAPRPASRGITADSRA